MSALLCEWGEAGIVAPRERVEMLVIVDVLSYALASPLQ